MIIRSEQMRALEEASWRGFEDRMIERVRTYFPKPAEQLGEAQLRVLIRYAAKRAERHKLTHERSIALYLDMMFVLGSNFDEDSQIPWAAAILADHTLPTQADRIDRLHKEGWEYGLKIEVDFQSPAENRSRLIEAIGEARRKGIEDMSPQESKSTSNEIILRLQTLFPAKCGIIGNDCVRGLVKNAFETASQYGIVNARGAWLFSALMFLLGTGFDSDPQFPWASQVLSEGFITDGAVRTNRLYDEARAALKRWWGVEVAAQV
jgi:hypothetical protein